MSEWERKKLWGLYEWVMWRPHAMPFYNLSNLIHSKFMKRQERNASVEWREKKINDSIRNA